MGKGLTAAGTYPELTWPGKPRDRRPAKVHHPDHEVRGLYRQLVERTGWNREGRS